MRDFTVRRGQSSAVVIRLENRSDSKLRLHPMIAIRAASVDSDGKRIEAVYLRDANPASTMPLNFGGARLDTAAEAGVDWDVLPRLVLVVESIDAMPLQEKFTPAVRSVPIVEASLGAHSMLLKVGELPGWCVEGTRLRIKAVLESAAGKLLAESNGHELSVTDE